MMKYKKGYKMTFLIKQMFFMKHDKVSLLKINILIQLN